MDAITMASTQDLPGRTGPASPAGDGGGGPVPYLSPGFAVDPDRSPARAVLVALILTGVVLSTLAMVAFIWYRWSRVQEPTTAVIVDGDASLDGTVITVRGPRTITTSLKPSNGFSVPILVEPGEYLVVAERDGQVILRKQVEVKRFLGVRFNLSEYVRQSVAAGTLTLPPRAPTTQTGYP
jgi:hypothetical protein